MKYKIIPLVFCTIIAFNNCSVPELKIVPTAENVIVGIVKEQNKTIYLKTLGIVNPNKMTDCAFKLDGRLEHVMVNLGDEVRQGQVLAIMSEPAYDTELEIAEEEVEKAKQHFQEAEEIFGKLEESLKIGGVAQVEFNNARLNKKTAHSTYKQALAHKKMLADRNRSKALTAPFSGIITGIYYKPGTILEGGEPVLSIADINLVVDAGVSNEQLSTIEVGVRANLYRKDLKVSATIQSIGTYPDEKTGLYPIKLVPESSSVLLHGSLVEVEIPLNESLEIYLPIDIIQSDIEDFVYLAHNKRAQRRYVQIKSIRGNEAMVDGLNVGDTIVLKGHKSLKEGSLLNPKF